MDEDSPGLIADLGVRGVWIQQGKALFDVRVADTDAVSYVSDPLYFVHDVCVSPPLEAVNN